MCSSVSIGPPITLADVGGPLAIGLWVMLAAVLALGGFLVALKVKSWSRRDQSPEPFTLQGLRDMRARKEITEREFSSLRAALLGRPSPTPPPDSSTRARPSGNEKQAPHQSTEPPDTDESKPRLPKKRKAPEYWTL